MKKHMKRITAIFAAMLIVSACAFTAFADNDYEGGDNSGYSDGDNTGEGGGESSGYGDNTGEGGDNTGYGDNTGNIDGGAGYVDGGQQSSAVYYDSSGNSYSDQNEVYVGGGQVYEPPASTAPSVPLFETDKKVDVDELSKNDWNDIAASLQTAGTPADGEDIDDFGFIQKNNSTSDNGQWILITGAALMLLSIAGFTYLIVAAVRNNSRRKAYLAGGAQSGKNGGHYSKPGASGSDYGDGYKTLSSKPSKGGRRYK